MKTHPDGSRQMILGTTGSGKTHYTLTETGNIPRLIAFDPKGTYRRDMARVDVVIEGDLGALVDYLRPRQWDGFRIVYEPVDFDEARQLHEVAKLISWMQAPYRDRDPRARKVALIVEEAHLGIPNPPKPDFNAIGRLAKMGREWGVDLYTVTHAPQDVSKRFREMMTDGVICFPVIGDDAVKAAAGMMTGQPGAIEAIANLQRYHFVRWQNGSFETRTPLKE